MLVSRIRPHIADNEKNCYSVVHSQKYPYSCQVHRSPGETPFSLVVSRHLSGTVTIDSTTALPPDADKLTKPIALPKRIVTPLATMRTKINKTLAQEQAHFKRDVDKKVRGVPVFNIDQMVYVNRPPLPISLADRRASARYNKVRPRWTRLLKVLVV